MHVVLPVLRMQYTDASLWQLFWWIHAISADVWSDYAFHVFACAAILLSVLYKLLEVLVMGERSSTQT